MTLQRRGFYPQALTRGSKSGKAQTGEYNRGGGRRFYSDCEPGWDTSGAFHGIAYTSEPLVAFLPERHTEHLQQLPGFIIIARGGHDGDFEAA
jgi:hypothetical protein